MAEEPTGIVGAPDRLSAAVHDGTFTRLRGSGSLALPRHPARSCVCGPVAPRPAWRCCCSCPTRTIRVAAVLLFDSIREALSRAGLATVHVLDEVGVKQCDRHRAFSYGRGDALD